MLLSIWAAVCMVMHTCILESSLGSLACPVETAPVALRQPEKKEKELLRQTRERENEAASNSLRSRTQCEIWIITPGLTDVNGKPEASSISGSSRPSYE